MWAMFGPARGREQTGHRPALVIASNALLQVVDTLAIVMPITTVHRGWPNHVPVEGPSGLTSPSWVITDQPNTVARERVTRIAGFVNASTMARVDVYLKDFVGL